MNFQVLTIEWLVISIGMIVGEATSTSLFYGGVVVATGLCLIIWCGGHVRPGRLEGGGISGPWRFMRHPEIVCRFLVVFGFLLMARAAWIFAVSTLILGWFYRQLVVSGDQELSRWMGPQFSVYRLFVPSILPQFLPVRLPQQGPRTGVHDVPWSFRKAWARREQAGVPALALVLLLIVIVTVQVGMSWNWLRGFVIVVFLFRCRLFLREWIKSVGDHTKRRRMLAKVKTNVSKLVRV